MTAAIHTLRNSKPIAGFLRVGHRGPKWFDNQLARGALPFRHYVFEPADKLVDAENRTRSEAQLLGGNANNLVVLERGA